MSWLPIATYVFLRYQTCPHLVRPLSHVSWSLCAGRSGHSEQRMKSTVWNYTNTLHLYCIASAIFTIVTIAQDHLLCYSLCPNTKQLAEEDLEPNAWNATYVHNISPKFGTCVCRCAWNTFLWKATGNNVQFTFEWHCLITSALTVPFCAKVPHRLQSEEHLM